jgi:fumarylacetoacetase
MNPMNETHDPRRRSWVESANREGCQFPIQNLPFGVFRRKGSKAARTGAAIGDSILDLAAAGFGGAACRQPNLNALAAAGRPAWQALRLKLSRALSNERGWEKRRRDLQRHLVPMAKAQMLLPVAVGDYTDCYSSVFHATNIGRMFRPDNPLLPNFKWLPIAYHGRASSVVVSGTPVVRPLGQAKAADAPAPVFGPCRRLDYEVELGLVVGPGNALGRPVPIARAQEHVFGVVLLNDWSARDIQAWEYQPLGPFLAKNFATTISPWIVTLEALAPFRSPAYRRPDGDPAPLPYLMDARDQGEGSFSIEVEMHLASSKMRAARLAAQRLSRCNFSYAYWTPAQMIAHHASNGCNLQPGDILGTGTISGPTADSLGAMIELTQGGKNPIRLPTGESRSFLEDGDEAIERGFCARDGYVPIGFGAAAGVVRPSPRH